MFVHHLLSIGKQRTCWWATTSAAATGGRRRTTEVRSRTGFGRRRWRWNELDVRWRQVASSRYTVSAILYITIALRIRTRSLTSCETESYYTVKTANYVVTSCQKKPAPIKAATVPYKNQTRKVATLHKVKLYIYMYYKQPNRDVQTIKPEKRYSTRQMRWLTAEVSYDTQTVGTETSSDLRKSF